MDFSKASESFKKLNPELFGVGRLPSAQPQPHGRRAPAGAHPPKKSGRRRLVISLVGFRRRVLDDDNFVGACKPLRDAISASLGIDDGDARLVWQYQQVHTRGREGVLVKVETI